MATTTKRANSNTSCPRTSDDEYFEVFSDRIETVKNIERTRKAVFLDEDLVNKMMRFAPRRFGDLWSPWVGYEDDVLSDSTYSRHLIGEFLAHWSVYQYPVEGRPVAAWYLDERGAIL